MANFFVPPFNARHGKSRQGRHHPLENAVAKLAAQLAEGEFLAVEMIALIFLFRAGRRIAVAAHSQGPASQLPCPWPVCFPRRQA
jgi:hypothetical protein